MCVNAKTEESFSRSVSFEDGPRYIKRPFLFSVSVIFTA